MRSVLRIFALAVFASSVSGAWDIAAAEPAVCAGLRQQLTTSSAGRSGSYGRAAQQQAIALQQTRIRERQAGCSGTLFSRGDPVQCAGFRQTVDRLSANVERLRGADSSQPASRSRILASLKANGCSGERPRGLLEAIFGKRDPVESAAPPRKRISVRQQPRETQKELRRSADPPEALATTYEGVDPATSVFVKKGYRTLCVRTCDGYYFPISFSTKPKNFARDQRACSAMCPAGKAKLYYHAVPQQESADMISVVGKVPYADLPNAFNYRVAGLNSVPGCSCHQGPQTDISATVETGEGRTDMARTPEGANSLSVFAGIDGVNAEEKTAGIGKPEAGSATHPATTRTEIQPSPDETLHTTVRIIGPAFFPEQSASLPPPQDLPDKKEVSTRYTVDEIISTIATDIWRRMEE